MAEQARLERTAQNMRQQGLDPNMTYLGPPKPAFRAPTGKEVAEYKSPIPLTAQMAGPQVGPTAVAATGNENRPSTTPNYSVVMEAKLKPGTFTFSDANHFRQANRQLYETMQIDPDTD